MGLYSDLQNKRVVVTGGASGIGYATAARFLDEGSRVVILDIHSEGLDAAETALPGLEGVVQTDVGSPEEVQRAFAEVDRLMGGIDVLISNAGVSYRCPFLDIPPEQWSRVMDINLGGMFHCSREAMSRMDAQGSGVILMTASTNGTEGHPYYTDYNASKAGVILLTQTMALEFAPRVRVNAICPGYVLTPMQKAEYTPEMLEATNRKIPMQRHAQPDEIAALFAFLASEQASYITGSVIPIDGGETAGLQ
ncbi:MAG: SDR family oxidoreductase [Synergistales bacterium]|nr:SDR family oxidoreductase [Synergistales bacterium]